MVYTAYNLSLINGSGVVPLLTTVNDNLMFGWYGNLALLTIGVIITLSITAYGNNFKKAIGFSSLVCAVFSIIFNTIGLVPDQTVILSWVIAAIVMMVAIFFPD